MAKLTWTVTHRPKEDDFVLERGPDDPLVFVRPRRTTADLLTQATRTTDAEEVAGELAYFLQTWKPAKP